MNIFKKIIKLDENLKIDIENESTDILSSTETYEFIKECLEKNGKVSITKSSENCLIEFQDLGLCSLSRNESIREYLEAIGIFALEYDKKIFQKLLKILEKSKQICI
ncbi:MAG: hypothetical protein ACRDA0_07345 [Cetobacterium sp.]|uniref:hypothetical protein n=1 Tax=Cetobacterium sp. TaxID=2071632 RepID=UPI003EE4CDB8